MKGKIKVLKDSWGFIRVEGKSDVFFGMRDFVELNDFNRINLEDELEFELSINEKGNIARKIKLVKQY